MKILLIFTFALWGCGGGLESTTEQDAAVVDGSPIDGNQNGTSQLAAGTYAGRQQLSLLSTGATGTSTTTLTVFQRIDVEAQNQGTVARTTTCKMSQEPALGVTVQFPQAFLDAIPETTGTVSTSTNSVSIQFPPAVMGAELVNPATDPLPTSAAAPTVTDDDMDSNPGVTAVLTGLVNADIYVAVRNIDILEGTTDSNGTFGGEITGSREQEYLGQSDNNIEPFLPTIQKNPAPGSSVFQWKPVSPEVSCSDIELQF